MATQLAEAPDQGGNDNGAINYEAEARKMGWAPADEFKGDPAKHVDAETFYTRGQEVMPILKSQNRKLIEEIDKLKREQKRSAEFFSKAEERAYDRAIADIKAKMADAVESGDTKAAGAAMDELANLEKPGAGQPGAPDDSQRAEELADWMKSNTWYGTNDALRIYADAQADRIVKAKGGKPLDLSDLTEVAGLVKAKFEDAFPDAFAAKPTKQARNPVDGGGTAPPRRGGRTFNDLPPEAQRICDKWVANGTIKSRDDYVKGYDFGDKK